MVFHWGLSDSKSSQVTRTLLSILANLNNVVVLVVSIRPPTFNSSKAFGTVSNAPVSIRITVILMFHIYLVFSQAPSICHFFRFLWFLPCDPPRRQNPKCFWLIRSDCLVEIKWSLCTLKSHRILCVSFSRTNFSRCIYHSAVWSNFNSLHDSQWITFPTQSYLIYFSARLVHSLTMWFICFVFVTPLSIFTNPYARTGYDKKTIFERSLTGLNSQFSFS